MKLKPAAILGMFLAALVGTALWLGWHERASHSLWKSLKNPEDVAQLKQFVAMKEAQAAAAPGGMSPEIGELFKEAERGDWLALSNSFSALSEPGPISGLAARGSIWDSLIEFVSRLKEKMGWSNHVPRPPGTPWAAAMEVQGALEAFSEGDETYSVQFGRDIIDSIPPGSIYFGGTDPGRFIVTAICPSQVEADPFFVLTQNALADGSYLDYLRQMYGSKISIPTADDSQKCFEAYVADASRRAQSGELKPGENVRTTGGGVQISGQVAVMEINGLLVKNIFDNNPGREFYVEESFPLDWMYPQLEPHGLIFKLNRKPAATLSDQVVQSDHDYWTKLVPPMIGDWLQDDTSVAEIAAFAEKTFGRGDLSGFTGDPRFIQNAYAHKSFSKLRSSIAGLYAWRVSHAADATDRERMAREADFAFRQAWALCPYSPEAVYRYVNFLSDQKRGADALLVAQTAADLPAMKGRAGDQVRALVGQLKK